MPQNKIRTADIVDSQITYAKIQNISATSILLGRNSAGAGVIEELNAATAKTLLALNNVENTALSTWAGSANITTLGTIATGTWNATIIDVAKGGTGVGTLTGVVIGNGTSDMTAVAGTASQLLRRNAGNTAYEFFTHDFINQAGARTAISLTVTGSSGAATYNNTTGVLNVPTYTLTGLGGVSGTGTANKIAYWSSASNITNDADLHWDPTTNSLGVAKASPEYTLDVAGNMRLTGSTGTGTTLMARDGGGAVSAITVSTGLALSNNVLTATGGTSGIGGTIAAGQVAFGTASNTVGGTNNLFWDNAANELGIGTNAPARTLHVEGTMRLTGSTGTGTTLMARDANGDVSAISVSTGLSLSNNVLTSTGLVNPMNTLGDTIYGAASGVATRLAGNTTTTKQFLSSTGNGSVSAAPSWSAVTKSDVGLANVENTALSTWTGSTSITTLGTIATGTWNATIITVAKGGTGVGTLTGVVIGNGTSNMSAVAGTASQLLRRNSGNTAYEFFTPDYVNQAGARTAISLTVTGSSGAATYNNTTGVLNVPTYTLAGLGGVGGTGTANKLAYFSAASTLTSDTDLHWDATNHRLGVFAASPAQTLHVAGTMRVTGSTGTGTTLMARDANGDVSAITVSTGLALSNNVLTATGGSGISGTIAAGQVAFGTGANAVSGTNNLFWDNATNELGIGTNTPAQNLHIQGTMRLTAVVEGTPTNIMSRDASGDVIAMTVGTGLAISGSTLIATGGTSGISGTIAAGQVAFGTASNTIGGNNNLFWDNTNIELGIGTNAPERTLHVAGTMRLTGSTGTGTTLMARDANGDISAVGFDANLTLTNNTLRYVGPAITGTGAATNVAFWDTSSTLSNDNNLYWDNTSKRLGLGTSSPNQTLEVAGTMRLTGSTGTPITLMGRNASGDISKIDVGAGLSLVGDDLVVLTATGITGSGTATQIAFFSGSTVIRSDSNLYWDNTNKRVGIATTSPLTPLDVRGKSAFGDSNITASNTERALNLIGADAVMRILRISANSTTASPAFELMHRTTANGTNTVFYDFYASSAGFFIRDRVATPAPGVERFAVDGSGRILFGGASFTSSAALQVSSTTGGFLPPKVTTTQRDAIGSPVSGLMVYNTSTNQMQFYNGSSWVSM